MIAAPRKPLLRIASSLVPPLLALGLQLAFWSQIRPLVWFLFYPAVFISVWLGGRIGGLAATVLATFCGWWFFIVPAAANRVGDNPALLSVGLFATVGILLSLFQGRLDDANQAIAAASERYVRTLDNMLEGCQILGPDWRYLYINETAASQGRFTRSALLGRVITEVYPGIEATEMFANLKRAASERIPIQMENAFTYPDGKQGWFELRIQPVPEGIFILSIDISERKQAQGDLEQLTNELERRVEARTADLERANRELEAFSYSVSHDLRTPLRAIGGFSGILLDSPEGTTPEERRHFLDRIRGGARRMEQLIDDLLTFSRLSRQAPERRTVDMGRMVTDIVEQLRTEHRSREIEVAVAPLPTVEGDEAMLHRVWYNLLSNAFKYTRDAKAARIEIGAEAGNDGPVFFVRDNGIGFDMQYVDKLFGVFQRLHGLEFEGTGVGLAIVDRVIRRHGGRVWADSRPGHGATFFVTLPSNGAPL